MEVELGESIWTSNPILCDASEVSLIVSRASNMLHTQVRELILTTSVTAFRPCLMNYDNIVFDHCTLTDAVELFHKYLYIFLHNK